ncbi:MAG: hypothetical protein KKC84_06050 [Candidatus Omnitrophica bacterium]|nr:hypothetical protein [Candidatus Omnitrophota bacterium]
MKWKASVTFLLTVGYGFGILNLHMGKSKIETYLLLLLFSFIPTGLLSAQEQVTLRTYYPSPKGKYETMAVWDKEGIGGELPKTHQSLYVAGYVGIGTAAVTSRRLSVIQSIGNKRGIYARVTGSGKAFNVDSRRIGVQGEFVGSDSEGPPLAGAAVIGRGGKWAFYSGSSGSGKIYAKKLCVGDSSVMPCLTTSSSDLLVGGAARMGWLNLRGPLQPVTNVVIDQDLTINSGRLLYSGADYEVTLSTHGDDDNGCGTCFGDDPGEPGSARIWEKRCPAGKVLVGIKQNRDDYNDTTEAFLICR